MERLCTRPKDGGHSRGGRQSVLGAVVRGQLSEFGNRVNRRHHNRTGTTAIGGFRTVDHVEVVRYTLAVKRDILVATHRRRNLKVPLQAARARSEVHD